MAQHKWHEEIKAWADGVEIEIRTPLSKFTSQQSWVKFQGNTFPMVEFEDGVALDVEYRIKPQPKEPQYLYVYATSKGYQFALKHGAVEVGSLNEIANCIGKIKLEVDDNGTI